MTPTTIERPAPRAADPSEPNDANESRAEREITRAVAAANSSRGVISTDTARLIAAAIHEGATTALGRFAATGELNYYAASTELWDLPTSAVPPDWWRAMDRFLQEEASDG